MASLIITAALIAGELVYLRGYYRLHHATPHLISVWRLAAFSCGLLTLWVAAGSPLAAMDHHLLTAHMAQHLVVMTVSAPLILLGAPVIVLLNGLPDSLASPAFRPLLKCLHLGALGRLVTHPLFCWLAGTGTVIAWHMPALFQLGMHSAPWHELEQGCFTAAGLLFWWPVIRPWPSLATWSAWGVPLYLFLATLPCDALSALLTFCGRVVYPHYLSVHPLFHVSPLGDQECAGALMWVWVTFAYLAPAVVITIQALSPQRRALNAKVA